METIITNDQQNVNIPLLEEKVRTFYSGDTRAQKALLEFSEHPAATKLVPVILTVSKESATRSYALNVIQNAVKTRWRDFTDEDKVELRSFAIRIAIKFLSQSGDVNPDLVLVPILNNILLQVAKRQWPEEWPSFITDVMMSSNISEKICANNLRILQMLMEELNENDDNLTSHQKKTMKPLLIKSSPQIFKICLEVFQNSSRPETISIALKTVNSFLPWLPKAFVFESPLLKTLAFNFVSHQILRNDAMLCLGTIASLDVKGDTPSYLEIMKNMFKEIVDKNKAFVSDDFDVNRHFDEDVNNFRTYILFLANFLVAIFQIYADVFDGLSDVQGHNLFGHFILVKISTVKNSEIFNICLEYWEKLTKDLKERKANNDNPIKLGRIQKVDPEKLNHYAPVLTKIRVVLIERMERPKEVLISQDENGRMVELDLTQSYNAARHRLMLKCLFNVAAIDSSDTRRILFERLERTFSDAKSQEDSHYVTRLSWAVGAISGALKADEEKDFLVHVIRELLRMCNSKNNREEKAVVASSIMYVIGQYPRFIKARLRFLKTVVNKLFEFMQETFPGMKHMAVETFATIVSECGAEMVRTSEDRLVETPMIYEIAANLNSVTCELNLPQLGTFLEALARIVRLESNSKIRLQLLERILEEPNHIWARIVSSASSDPEGFFTQEVLMFLERSLRLSISVARGAGPVFAARMDQMFVDALQLFESMTRFVSGAVSGEGVKVERQEILLGSGAEVLKDFRIKKILRVRSELVEFFQVYIESIGNCNETELLNKFVPPLYGPILRSYVESHPLARDHNVLSFFSIIVDKLQEKSQSIAREMFGSVIRVTLEMIKNDFVDFPDHRRKFFALLKSITTHCFPVLEEFTTMEFRIVLTAMVFGAKHSVDEISSVSLETLQLVVEKINFSGRTKRFYTEHLFWLISELLKVVGDTVSYGQFDTQCKILQKLFFLIESGDITFPLYDVTSHFKNNRSFVKKSLNENLILEFEKRLTIKETEMYSEMLLKESSDSTRFNELLNDFRLQSRINRVD